MGEGARAIGMHEAVFAADEEEGADAEPARRSPARCGSKLRTDRRGRYRAVAFDLHPLPHDAVADVATGGDEPREAALAALGVAFESVPHDEKEAESAEAFEQRAMSDAEDAAMTTPASSSG